MRAHPGVLVAATALVAAGCGTTVSGTASTPGAGGDALSVPSPGTTGGQGLSGPSGAAGSGGGLTTGSTVTGGGSGAGSATGSGSTAAPPLTGSGSGSGPAATAGNGPGITPTTIYVGESWDPNVAAADSAIGAASGDPGDVHAETNALIAYINAHGGVAHRKVVPIWHQISSKDDASTSAEATCQAWTRDHKVFVLSGG
ncbi:MAG: hypothetical protein JO222_00330, partial [Frankiales bacterium]|nr:hypothetical protein [Frankiales bacterium]